MCRLQVVCVCICFEFFFFFKQKTAYEMRISDWSSDVCSSDLAPPRSPPAGRAHKRRHAPGCPSTRAHNAARKEGGGAVADQATSVKLLPAHRAPCPELRRRLNKISKHSPDRRMDGRCRCGKPP